MLLFADWLPPTEVPDLRRAGVIALDLETRDGGLAAGRGSAWPWGDGHICGVAVAYREENNIRARYFPLRHPDTKNFDHAQIVQWLNDLIASDVHIVTQNGLYDWGWLRSENIKMPPAERLEEIGALATLVDENRFSYSLDALCAWRGLPGKDETLLKEAAAAYGFPKRAKPQTYLWQLPARYVGPYAETDAANTLALWEDLNPILDREGTRDAYRLEMDLLPMVHEMRRRGIRIDVAAAEKARDHLLQKRDAVFAELSDKIGANVGMAEIGRTAWLAETFDEHGIKYPRTANGNPSFTAGNSGWMPKHSHWLPQLIVRADKHNNAGINFLQGHILDHVVNGRVHAEIHPHRSDEGGTRSLRFSYSNPPLQLMPSRDEELTPLIRGVFLPEEGEVWAKPDVSQQEFRFIVHYAAKYNLLRAGQAVDRYHNDPDTDFHNLVVEMTGLDRQSAKAVNFAKAFGAGVYKFAVMTNKPKAEARALYARYDRELPFVSQLARGCQKEAVQCGFLELYDGARRHWDNWEARGIPWGEGAGPCSREEAERRISNPEHSWHGRELQRAETHKAMNALIQGSAARHTKLWMRACWREGIVPLLQMHDALDCSVSSPEQAERVAQLGCEAVKLAVPIRVDLKYGRNWGDAKHTWDELQRIEPKSQPTKSQSASQSATPAPTSNVATNVPKMNGFHAAFVPAPQQVIEGADIPMSVLISEPLVDGKIICPFHDDSTPSLHVYPDHFHCFACGAHGDHVDWLMMVENKTRAEAEHILKTWNGPAVAPKRRNGAEHNARTLALAARIWEKSRPIAGTLAVKYLAEVRKIDVDALPDSIADALRFHENCPFRSGVRYPCLIGLYRDVETGVPAGIHRIALTPKTLAGGKAERRTLGSWPAPRTIKLWPAADQLFLGEGIETTLAAATRITHQGAPMRPAWAAGVAGNMESFPVVEGIRQLVILADNDSSGTGQAAADECARRWYDAKRDAICLMPPETDTDFNDLVRA